MWSVLFPPAWLHLSEPLRGLDDVTTLTLGNSPLVEKFLLTRGLAERAVTNGGAMFPGKSPSRLVSSFFAKFSRLFPGRFLLRFSRATSTLVLPHRTAVVWVCRTINHRHHRTRTFVRVVCIETFYIARLLDSRSLLWSYLLNYCVSPCQISFVSFK